MSAWDLAPLDSSVRLMLGRFLEAESIGFEWRNQTLVAAVANGERVGELVELASGRRVQSTLARDPSDEPKAADAHLDFPGAAAASGKGCALVVGAFGGLNVLILVLSLLAVLVNGPWGVRWLAFGTFALWTGAWVWSARWLWRRADGVGRRRASDHAPGDILTGP